MSKIHPETYMPPDKSWLMRLGILSLRDNYLEMFLEKISTIENRFGGDLKAFKRCLENWNQDELYVGESATLFRFLQFYIWQNNLTKKLVKEGSLLKRRVSEDPDIIFLSQRELLNIDEGTTQWASAKVLCGDKERIDDAPAKLVMTYRIVDAWNSMVLPEYSDRIDKNFDLAISRSMLDSNICNHVFVLYSLLAGHDHLWLPLEAEDYCFARSLSIMTQEDGQTIWPQLANHESNRLEAMEEALDQLYNGKPITSQDHRVIHAVVMKALIDGIEVNVVNREAVNKSWTRFWDFIEVCKKNKTLLQSKGNGKS